MLIKIIVGGGNISASDGVNCKSLTSTSASVNNIYALQVYIKPNTSSQEKINLDGSTGKITTYGDIFIGGNKTLTVDNISSSKSYLTIDKDITATDKSLSIGTITSSTDPLNITQNISAAGKYIKSKYLLLERLTKIEQTQATGLIATTYKDNYYHMIFKNSASGSSGGSYTSCKSDNAGKWYKISDPDSGYNPYSMTINHISLIEDNTNLNNYQIGKPIFLNNKYYNYDINSEIFDEKFIKTNYNKININSNTVNSTFFNITNIPNNNFVGICSIISEEVIVKQSYNETFKKYFFSELTNEQIQEQNLNINNLPEDYIKLYKIKQSLDIFLTDFFYFDKPVVAFATHGDYMFYVNDTEALIDTNLNTQKHYEIGDELTYDGKILILPEFNPNDNLTEPQQLQELINYNKQMSNYNKLKKNSIGKISHIFTQQECDDYKHYLAVFKSN